MSRDGKIDLGVIAELEQVAKLVAAELDQFRRRAQKAEAAQADIDGGEYDVVTSRSRIVELESENHDLRARVDEATERTNELLARLRFLEEQMAIEGVG